MNTLLLLILALAPGFILLYFILYMDRADREPLGQVVKIMLLGALSAVPVALIEYGLMRLPLLSGHRIGDAVIIAFFQVAWVEELGKLGVVLLFAWKSKHFNEENDGIVYVGASALGFAMLENVGYVLGYGVSTGILRALTAMPLHCFTGVIMGYYLGLAKFSPTPPKRKINIFTGFFAAYLIHAIYDALLLTRTPAALLIVPIVIALFIFGIRFLKKGRALSLARLEAPAEPLTPVIIQQTAPGNQLWKIIISRSLLVISSLFWLLVLVSLSYIHQTEYNAADLIAGAVLMSFLPILVGVLLENSYQRKKKIHRSLQNQVPEPVTIQSPHVPYQEYPETAALSPPGQFWRAITGRTLLTVSGLFWAMVIFLVLPRGEHSINIKMQGLAGAWFLSFFPIFTGILLEISYRQRKQRFNELRNKFPNYRITAAMLRIAPPGQLWKIIVSRFLFGVLAIWWGAVILLILFPGDTVYPAADALLGSIIVSAGPLAGAIMLEKSFQAKRKNYQAPVPLTENEDLSLYAQQLKQKRIKELWD